MNNNSFFDESTEASQVKARIVEKYFWAWAKIIISHAKKRNSNIGYVDLFAGPGQYKDGSKSTPILVLEKAIENEDIRDRLISIFNDIKPDYVQRLEIAINSIRNIDSLKTKPIVSNKQVGEEVAEILEKVEKIPTLFFLDPWGYKGLSLQLISSAVKNWGCDCIFFFNYNRINMGVNNEIVKEDIDALFGSERAEALRHTLQSMNPSERELKIVEEISQSLKSEASEYVRTFRFKRADGKRSSHHLIFLSKHIRGYEIMKEIMAKESTDAEQGVPSFEYNPADHRQLPLFGYSRPLDDLAEMLLADFAGRTMTMKQIHDQHNVGTRYISKNYKAILIKLEAEGKIRANPPSDKRLKNTFGDNVKVTFPPKDG